MSIIEDTDTVAKNFQDSFKEIIFEATERNKKEDCLMRKTKIWPPLICKWLYFWNVHIIQST